MSEFNLTDLIEEFCSHAAYVEENGRSKLQALLFKTQKTIEDLVLELLSLKQYELISKFLKKVNKYPVECAEFLESPDLSALCSTIAEVVGKNEMKVSFIQLFITRAPSAHSRLAILFAAISWVASESLELSDCCSQVLYSMAAADVTLAPDVVGQIMPHLAAVQEDSTKHLRYLCLLASFMKISSEYFLLCEAKGAVEVVISSCQCPDILMQTISLEFLVDISASPAGAAYLFEHKQVHWLVAMGGGEGGAAYLDANQGHAVDDFLVAQATSCAAKVLKNVEQQAPHLLYDYISQDTDAVLATVLTQPSASSSPPLLSVFMSGLLDLLEQPGEADRLACLEAIVTYATSSPRAFLLLLSSDSLLSSWLDLLRKQPSMQASTLHSIAQVLMYPAVLGDFSPSVSFVRAVHTLPAFSALSPAQFSALIAEMDAIKRKLFGQICVQLGTSQYQSTMQYLVKLARGPIGELKHAAYDVLRALAYQTQSWGVHTLFEFTGFYPFLLDRSTEHAKTGKDWKFSLLEALHHSPHILLLVDAIPARIHDLIREGAYHTPLEVAGPMTMEL